MSNIYARKKIVFKSAKETQGLAFNLALGVIGQKPRNQAVVLALSGDLGSGKTTFLQGFALGLGIKEKITSPTFVIMKKFKIPNDKSQTVSYKLFYHFDCYRLRSAKDVLGLGFKEIIANPQNVVALEWPENIKTALPKTATIIRFVHKTATQRQIEIS